MDIKETLETTQLLEMVSRFVRKDSNQKLLEHSMQFIGNVTNSGIESVVRERLLKNGIFHEVYEIVKIACEKLLAINMLSMSDKDHITQKECIELINSGIWLFSNLMKGTPFPPVEYYETLYCKVVEIVVFLTKFSLNDVQEFEIVCCLLNFLKAENDTKNSKRIDFLMQQPNFVINLLGVGNKAIKSKESKVVLITVHLFGFISAFDYGEENDYISRIIFDGICEFLIYSFTLDNVNFDKYAAFVLSNIFTEKSEHLYKILKNQS